MPKTAKPYSAILPVVMLIAAVLACNPTDPDTWGEENVSATETAHAELFPLVPTATETESPATVTARAQFFATIDAEEALTEAAASQTAAVEQETAAVEDILGAITETPPTTTATAGLTTTPPTPTPTPPFEQAALRVIEAGWTQDQLEDGLDCASGNDSLTPLPPQLDLIGSSSGNDAITQEAVFGLKLNTPMTQTVPLAGGVEFFDPIRPLAEDPNWFFNTTGNVSFNFMWDPSTQQMETSAAAVSQAGAWEPMQTELRAGLTTREGFAVFLLVIPMEEVPAGSKWFGTVTNFAVCDEHGLGADNLPGFMLPENP